jgi:sugar phosphate isomerase/epimerase
MAGNRLHGGQTAFGEDDVRQPQPIPDGRRSWRRCFSSLGCPALTLDEIVALAHARGIAAVELRAVGGTIDLVAALRRGFASPADLRAWIKGKPIGVAMVGSSFRLHGGTAADREALLALAAWAEALGSPWLRVYDGCAPGDDRAIADAAAALAWWDGERARRGLSVDLAVETHDATADPVALAAFLAAAPRCRILWDAHHTWRRGGEPPATTWATVRRHVVHIHFKDSVATPGFGEGYAYVLPATGEYPLGELAAVLAAEDYAGALCLEWERLWHPALAPLEAALDRLERLPWWRQAAPSPNPGAAR